VEFPLIISGQLSYKAKPNSLHFKNLTCAPKSEKAGICGGTDKNPKKFIQ
jgi:hypothetical protein